ncbi:hypothetical protein M1N59_01360 [Dehalococcoidales bacterium]|nr:hypothetical protein [Dehalococcoidales bacterium]
MGYPEGAQGERHTGKLVGELGKPSAEAGVDHLIADSRRLHSTYLRNARDETVTKLREQGTAPELVATSSVERVARLLEEVRLNGTGRLEF